MFSYTLPFWRLHLLLVHKKSNIESIASSKNCYLKVMFTVASPWKWGWTLPPQYLCSVALSQWWGGLDYCLQALNKTRKGSLLNLTSYDTFFLGECGSNVCVSVRNSNAWLFKWKCLSSTLLLIVMLCQLIQPRFDGFSLGTRLRVVLTLESSLWIVLPKYSHIYENYWPVRAFGNIVYHVVQGGSSTWTSRY